MAVPHGQTLWPTDDIYLRKVHKRIFIITSCANSMIMKENARLVGRQCWHLWHTGHHFSPQNIVKITTDTDTVSLQCWPTMLGRVTWPLLAGNISSVFSCRWCSWRIVYRRWTINMCSRSAHILSSSRLCSSHCLRDLNTFIHAAQLLTCRNYRQYCYLAREISVCDGLN